VPCESEPSKGERPPKGRFRTFRQTGACITEGRVRAALWTFGSEGAEPWIPRVFYAAPLAGSSRLSKMRIAHRLRLRTRTYPFTALRVETR
jgi:hypothetical protein